MVSDESVIDYRKTSMEGNYVTYDQLYQIENELNSTSTNHLSLSFCLMPTEFCVIPYTVSQSGKIRSLVHHHSSYEYNYIIQLSFLS